MYEYLYGKISELAPTYCVVDVMGVGYMVNISLQTYKALQVDTPAKLYTHFVVREDAQILYGFFTKDEREFFRLLTSVSGVGGSTARMVLSTYTVDEISNIVATQNASLLKNVKGLGLKSAQKIIVELSGKLPDLGEISSDKPSSSKVARSASFDEALQALTMLGYQKVASEKALTKIFEADPDITTEQALKLAFKHIS
ncbi:MAG: Holliday junction branch migration protein RuvA [Alistipes sp.]|nr:Holliday junction branch migration protein RuvA [Candidatus Alistipes equi]